MADGGALLGSSPSSPVLTLCLCPGAWRKGQRMQTGRVCAKFPEKKTAKLPREGGTKGQRTEAVGPGRHHHYPLRTEPSAWDPGWVWQDVGSHLGQEVQENICGSLSGHDKLWELVIRSNASPSYPSTKDLETLKSYLTNGQNLIPISPPLETKLLTVGLCSVRSDLVTPRKEIGLIKIS